MLSLPLDTERLTDLFVVSPGPLSSIARRVRSMSDLERQALAMGFELELAGRTEAVPFAIDRCLFDRMQRAAVQRLRAARCFLEDIYSRREPRITREHPELSLLLQTSPYFDEGVVGTEMASSEAWDFVLAMDWVVVRNRWGELEARIVESDSGGVAGVFHTAMIHEAVSCAWSEYELSIEFEDSRSHIFELLTRLSTMAARRGGHPLFYTEHDLERVFRTPNSRGLQRWLADADIPVASNWNNSALQYVGGRFGFNGREIASWYLRSYTSSLDPTWPGYAKVREIYDNPYDRSLAIDGFWRNYVDGGYRSWTTNNPVGCEIFVDKAISTFLGRMIRFYLPHEHFEFDGDCHVLLIDSHGRRRSEVLEEIRRNPSEWVIKPRRSRGGGLGVCIGALYESRPDDVGRTWDDIVSLVDQQPGAFVAQEYAERSELQNIGLEESRQFEVRNIAWSLDGRVDAASSVLVRSSPKGGAHQNIMGHPENSRVPIVVPRNGKPLARSPG
jgi:hypothetical protein